MRRLVTISTLLAVLLTLPAWDPEHLPAATAPSFTPSECAGHGNGRVYGKFHVISEPDQATVVYLIRDGPYTEWYLRSRLYEMIDSRGKHDYRVTPFDRLAKTCLKITTSDSSGSFAFENIPPGRYYILSNVEYRFTVSTTSDSSTFTHENGDTQVIGGGSSSSSVHGMQLEYSQLFDVSAGDALHLTATFGYARIDCGRLPKDTCPGETSADP